MCLDKGTQLTTLNGGTMSMRRKKTLFARRYINQTSVWWMWLHCENIERNGEKAEGRMELIHATLPLITVR